MTCSRLLIAIALAVCLDTDVRAAELHNVKMPDTVTLAGKPLALNGMGTREYSVFKVKVYVAGLYLEQAARDEASILDSPGTKQVRMEFLREVTEPDMRKAWLIYLKDNAHVPWEAIDKPAQSYLSLLPGVKPKDVLVHDFVGESVTVSLNEKTLGAVSSRDFGRTLLSTWIGKRPTTEEMKSDLLGVVKK